jgi:Yip1 domain
MNIVERAKNILLSPKTEWPVIAAEPATTGSLLTYAAILAVIPMVGSLLAGLIFGGPLGLGFVLATSLVGFIIGLGVLFLMGIITSALAPSFDGRKDSLAGLKLVVYASTPTFVLGILNIIPGINIIAALVGFAYAVYLIYLGATPVNGVPQGKAGGFAAVIVIIWILIYFILAAIIGGIVAAAMMGGAMGGAAMSTY